MISLISACGRTSVSVPDQKEFDQAISRYLKMKHMGLKIVEYRQFENNKTKATAVVALSAADEGTSQAKVRFRFYI